MSIKFFGIIGATMFFLGCLGTKTMNVSEKSNPQKRVSTHTDTTNDHMHEDTDAEVKHLLEFQRLVNTDPEAARTALSKSSEIKFGKHPLVKEWEQLFFRLLRDKKGTILDLKRFNELHLQMLKDIDPEKNAKEIEYLQNALKKQEFLIESIRKQGDSPETFESEFSLSIE